MKLKQFFVNAKENIMHLYKKNKKLFFISLAIIILFIIILFFPLNTSSLTKQHSDKIDFNVKDTPVSGDYVDDLENKLTSMLLSLRDVSMAKVLIVTNSSVENNYLKSTENIKTTNQSGESLTQKEEIAYEKNGSSQNPVKVSVNYPKIEGVLIFLNKVDSLTKNNIENAISSVLNVESEYIYILVDR